MPCRIICAEVQYLNMLPKQEQGINRLELSSSSKQVTPLEIFGGMSVQANQGS